ncbi:MAG TPA: ABC transporter substrate-binding protein, partial [Candidatus Limnocylindrales bacterium]
MPASQTPTSRTGPLVPPRHHGPRPGPRAVAGAALAALALVASACGGGVATAPIASPTPSAPVKLVVGLGYIPNIQFAQFYLADQAGYYRNAGLQVEFQNKIDPEL